MDVLADLRARGLIQDSTDPDALARRLVEGPTGLYYGCDPSADSLHIGNLIGILVMRRFAAAGHRPLALAGGATGMIGDPSGKSEERNLFDAATLGRNVEAIAEQLARIGGVDLVDNAAWTAPLSYLEFLRDVGKHVTVNQMVAKESVRARMDATAGISYTEFSYMLLQAHDYLVLARDRGIELQIGGSDQWGNITLGVDLVRKVTGRHVHALTWPLLVRSDGRKFGKTEEGTVWLAAHRTSPYRFFQYWMQVPDADVRKLLAWFTLLPVEECEAVTAAHLAAPEQRGGQRRLAREVTTLVHGEEEARAAEAAAAVLFGGEAAELEPAALAAITGEVPTTQRGRDALVGASLVELLADTGLAGSRGDARRTVEQGGAYVNGRRVTDPDARIDAHDLLHGRWVLLRKGKRQHHLVEAR